MPKLFVDKVVIVPRERCGFGPENGDRCPEIELLNFSRRGLELWKLKLLSSSEQEAGELRFSECQNRLSRVVIV